MHTMFGLKLQIKFDEINEHFFKRLDNDSRQKHYSLLSGRSGSIFFLYQQYKLTPTTSLRHQIDQNLNYVFGTLQESTSVMPTYCDGLAGWGWLIIYLKTNGYLNEEYDEILYDLDEILIPVLEEFVSKGNFDLLHGALGIGLYFLKRKQDTPVITVINALNLQKIVEGDTIKWSRFDFLSNKQLTYDLSLPHGIAGILYFISKCYEAEIMPAVCTHLLSGGINFYFRIVQDVQMHGSYFPNKINNEDFYERNSKPELSRLAWCYGDLTVLYCLLRIVSLLSLEEKKSEVIIMLQNLNNRRHQLLTSVSEASLCHGSAGVAYIFFKLFQITNLKDFLTSASYWLEESLAYSGESGFAGYTFEISNKEHSIMVPSSAILEGIGGIGLIFLSFLSYPAEVNWDELVFLS